MHLQRHVGQWLVNLRRMDCSNLATRCDAIRCDATRQVYYNGTSERYWWNQDSDAVNVYVPVPEGFEPNKIEFVAKTRQISLKFAEEEVCIHAQRIFSLGGGVAEESGFEDRKRG